MKKQNVKVYRQFAFINLIPIKDNPTDTAVITSVDYP